MGASVSRLRKGVQKHPFSSPVEASEQHYRQSSRLQQIACEGRSNTGAALWVSKESSTLAVSLAMPRSRWLTSLSLLPVFFDYLVHLSLHESAWKHAQWSSPTPGDLGATLAQFNRLGRGSSADEVWKLQSTPAGPTRGAKEQGEQGEASAESAPARAGVGCALARALTSVLVESVRAHSNALERLRLNEPTV